MYDRRLLEVLNDNTDGRGCNVAVDNIEFHGDIEVVEEIAVEAIDFKIRGAQSS